MARFGTDPGMGPGDPIPTVIELAKPLRVEDFRHMFLFLANTLGLRLSAACVELWGLHGCMGT